jgi:hypothetical protein
MADQFTEVMNLRRVLQTLKTLWLQQEEDSLEFIHSLLQMKNKINKICVDQMVQTNIRKFFKCS